jgi:hypothetical protein
MNPTNESGDIPEVLPTQDVHPHVKRHCPVCGGEDFVKFSAIDLRDLVGEEGVEPLAHLLAKRQRAHQWGSARVYFGYSFIDRKTGKEVEGHVADPFLRLCLSCGFMAWHLNRADLERIRELRDRLQDELD